MRLARLLFTATLVTCLFGLSELATAQDAIKAPAQKSIGSSKSEMIPSLAVLNSRSASLQGGKLTLSGVGPNSIVFADRPVRAAGHVLTSHFLRDWDPGTGTFAKDPPNATVSVLSNDGSTVKDAVVVLKTPKLEGDQLTFDVEVLEGDLANADGPASVFIDWFAVHGGGGGWAVGGGWHPGWHGAWYGHPGFYAGAAAGVAVGAAAASAYYHPYYRPPCGYYPYPPCY